MFQKGDRVRVVMPEDQIDGLIGEIYRVDLDTIWPVLVEFKHPNFVWPFNYDELEKVDD